VKSVAIARGSKTVSDSEIALAPHELVQIAKGAASVAIEAASKDDT
jgi:hypothetical protein